MGYTWSAYTCEFSMKKDKCTIYWNDWLVKMVVHFFSTSFLVFVQVRSLRLVERAPLWKDWETSAEVICPLARNQRSNQSIKSNQSNLFNHVTSSSSHMLVIEHRI